MMSIHIRPEGHNDQAAIDVLNRNVFSGSSEANLVQLLRDRGELAISLVAIESCSVVGHVAASPVTVDGEDILMIGIGPIAVHESKRKLGIGASLMNSILNNASEIGFKSVVLLGDPKYYSRFGFESASNFSLGNEYNATDGFMAMELQPHSLQGISGLVQYASAFAECDT